MGSTTHFKKKGYRTVAAANSNRRTLKPPSYRLHKGSGQARVRLNGDTIYLGVFGSEESKRKYAALIAEYSAGAIFDDGAPATVNSDISVSELILSYLKFAKSYYVKNGEVTDEYECLKSAVRDLNALYGGTPVNPVLGANSRPLVGQEGFGPIQLKAVRELMIQPRQKKIGRSSKTIQIQWTRRYINQSINRIRRMFKWGVEQNIVDPNVLLKLQAIAPLTAGRTTAKEHVPRSAVPTASIEKVKGKVPQRTSDLIDLWSLTGARPGELIKLTGEMIDKETYQADGVWVAELADHKMVHKKKRRALVFGPKAQTILTRYLTADPSKRLFPINRATASDAMKKACREFGIPIFTAHWLRHTAATRIREDYDLDAAQVTLGHAKADTTEIYAGLNLKKAIEVARDVG